MVAKNQTEGRTLTLGRGKFAIIRAIKCKRPIFSWGPTGIGKSDLVFEIANDMPKVMVDGNPLPNKVIDLRMALMEPTDLHGIPYFDKNKNVMKWAPPVCLPSQEDASAYGHIILFLDELNSAPPATQAAAYQLVLNRQCGEYKLPDNVSIVAAGNRETDRGVVYRMPSPLANRFVHIELRSDFDTWLDWAINNQVHAHVIGFLSANKNFLYNFDPKSSERAFATPRAWVTVGELINTDDDDVPMTDTQINDLVSGTIGEGLAIQFQAHYKHAKDLPLPENVLAGKVKKVSKRVKDSISAQYSLTISTCYELKDAWDKEHIAGNKFPTAEWNEKCDNVLFFMMRNFEEEVAVMGAQMMVVQYKLPLNSTKLKSFNEFHKRFGAYILGAIEATT